MARTCRWKWIAYGLGIVLTALVIAHGADRTPADSSQSIVLVGATHRIPPGQRTIRVASFNIHSGKDRNRRFDLRRTVGALNCQFDLVGLNEVRGRPWSNQAEQLGRELGLAAAYAPAERQWWHDHFGNAVLSRRPLDVLQRIPFPGTRGKAFRNVVLVSLPWGDRSVRFLITHIDRAGDREMQLRLVVQLFRALQPPAVLMGDLNSTMDDPQLAALMQEDGVHSALHDGLPNGPPDDTIDWLFHRGLETVSAELIDEGISDHPLLSAELALPD